MQWIRQLISYALTIGVILALVTIIPRCSRLRVAPEYNDIDKLETEQSLIADTGVHFSALAVGDPVAYRLGDQETTALALGWIAALPGDEVAISGKAVMVNGKKAAHGDSLDLPDRGPVMIPTGHCFVVSDHHLLDSVAYGPLPASAIRGHLRNLP